LALAFEAPTAVVATFLQVEATSANMERAATATGFTLEVKALPPPADV
jgi:hypothetical protein